MRFTRDYPNKKGSSAFSQKSTLLPTTQLPERQKHKNIISFVSKFFKGLRSEKILYNKIMERIVFI